MLKIEARQMLGGVVVAVQCHHGWRDHAGHALFTEVLDCDGEDTEQLAVCVQDALNHWLKNRTAYRCQVDETSLELLLHD